MILYKSAWFLLRYNACKCIIWSEHIWASGWLKEMLKIARCSHCGVGLVFEYLGMDQIVGYGSKLSKLILLSRWLVSQKSGCLLLTRHWIELGKCEISHEQKAKPVLGFTSRCTRSEPAHTAFRITSASSSTIRAAPRLIWERWARCQRVPSIPPVHHHEFTS